jgi:hypothetical protein
LTATDGIWTTPEMALTLSENTLRRNGICEESGRKSWRSGAEESGCVEIRMRDVPKDSAVTLG